jgi:hypothetical protein
MIVTYRVSPNAAFESDEQRVEFIELARGWWRDARDA